MRHPAAAMPPAAMVRKFLREVQVCLKPVSAPVHYPPILTYFTLIPTIQIIVKAKFSTVKMTKERYPEDQFYQPAFQVFQSDSSQYLSYIAAVFPAHQLPRQNHETVE